MKTVFERIREEKEVTKQRFPVSIEGVATFDDMKLVIRKLLEINQELVVRLDTLEKAVNGTPKELI